MIVRSCGAIREIVFAGSFGVSQETDGFFLALTYATFVPSVLASALTTTIVARLASVSGGQGRPDITSLASLGRGVCVAGLITTLATYVLAPLVLSTLFNLQGANLENAVSFSRILAPLGATMILSASMDAILNSAKQFFVAGVTSAATPVTMIAAIVFFGGGWGIEAAAWGMIAGGIAEVVILAYTIARQRRTLFGEQRLQAAAAENAAFWRGVSFLACSAMIAAISPVVDQVFLSRLETGAITTFTYASKVNSLIIGLFGTAFSVAIYPYLTDLAAQRNTAALTHLSFRISALVLPVTAGASTIVFLFSYEIVQLLFARGSFTEADTSAVAHIQRIFAFQLVFYAAGLVAMRVLNAVGAAAFVFWISCIGVTLNALFDWLLYARMGAGGIALSSVLTSVASLLTALLFIRTALRRRHQLPS
jgi:putative peptidoglycan lipid II flippase